MGLFSSNKNGKNGTKINTKSSMQNKKSKKTTPFDVPKTVQDSIPYLGVYENGIFQNDAETFSKIYKIPDINFLTEDKPEWEGTATELVSQLPDMQIQANVLSRKLNVVNSQLLNDYGIFYDNKRGHERKIILKRLEPRE